MESAGDAESRQTKDTLETIRFNQNQADSSRPAGRRRPALRAPAEPASSQIFMVPLRVALTGLRSGIGSIGVIVPRSEDHTSELQSLMHISSAVFRLKTHRPPTHCTTVQRVT